MNEFERRDYNQMKFATYLLGAIGVAGIMSASLIQAYDQSTKLTWQFIPVYIIPMICSLSLYKIYLKYDGKNFKKYRVHMLIAAGISVALLIMRFVRPRFFEGYGMSRGGVEMNAESGISFIHSYFMIMPAADFLMVGDLIRPKSDIRPKEYYEDDDPDEDDRED